jgi:hypothetical protein
MSAARNLVISSMPPRAGILTSVITTSGLERAGSLAATMVERADTPRGRTDLVGGLLALADAQPASAARATIREAGEVVAPLQAALAAAPDDVEIRQAIADAADGRLLIDTGDHALRWRPWPAAR